MSLERREIGESWSAAAMESLHHRKVLVVDDNPINRLIFEKQLAALGVNVAVADGAEMAVSKLRAAAEEGDPFDAAIIDHLMPGTDGVELASTIRNAPWATGLQLVLSSSAGLIKTGSRARDYGFDGTLPKPLRPGALLKCVAGLFVDPPEAAPQATTSAATSAANDTDVPSTGRARILLAEDNHVNQLLTTAVVKAAGYNIDVVANGLEAVEALRNRPYDLVLMDIQMPELDGMEATRQVRLLSNDNATIPIIGVTAYAMSGDQERFMQAGMSDYMSKPIDTRGMVEKIAFWLGDDETAAGDPGSQELPDDRGKGDRSRQKREAG